VCKHDRRRGHTLVDVALACLSTGKKIIDTPESMVAELGAWNGGLGVDLETWIACEGRFALAVGYAAMFWPSFVHFDGYILPDGFSEESLRGFERRLNATRKSTESVMNHFHPDGIQYGGCKDISKDKLLLLGRVLKEIYEVKLLWQFPEHPCVVEFFVPDDEDDLGAYQLSFWQRRHEERAD
jgi:hypothetical protein